MALSPLWGLSTAAMRDVEASSFQDLSLPSRIVMESAGRAVALEIVKRYQSTLKAGAIVFCGPGNNGGDGYIAARTLAGLGVSVQAISLCELSSLRGEALASYDSWQRSGGVTTRWPFPMAQSDGLLAAPPGVVVDAIFGIGLSRAVAPEHAACFQFISDLGKHGADVVALDLPSGVQSDTGVALGASVKATLSVTFQALKFAHVAGLSSVGEVVVADVGIRLPHDAQAAEKLPDPARRFVVLERETLRTERARLADSSLLHHKGSKGHVLLVGGRSGQSGSIVLSSRAAFRAGAGLVTVCALDHDLLPAIAPHPTVMTFLLDGATPETFERLVSRVDAVVVGPGLGIDEKAAAILERTLRASAAATQKPVVLDADALSLIGSRADLAALCRPETIYTPHPGEAGRMLGTDSRDVQADRLAAVQRLSEKFPGITILKGAHSIVGGAEVQISARSDSTLATAGSGDVLSGILGAMLARGLAPKSAAACGVFLHAACGYHLTQHADRGCGATAEDILECIPSAISAFLQSNQGPETRSTRSLYDDEFQF